MYVVVVVAFGSGLFVLHKNHRAAIGAAHYAMQTSDCNLDTGLPTALSSINFLVEVTLSGADWQCFKNSSSDAGILIAVCDPYLNPSTVAWCGVVC